MIPIDHGETRTDRALLAAARANKHDAFAELFDRHVRPVFWQAFSVLADSDGAQDVVQETFYTLWDKRDSVYLADESVLPWLMVTARNLALNAGRKSKRRRTVSLVDSTPADSAAEPEQAAARSETAALISNAVAKLSELDRELFALCVEQELSYDAAAAQLGVSHGTVRNRLSRLKLQLRKDLTVVREES